MTQAQDVSSRSITLAIRPRMNEQGEHMLWLASWLVGEQGEEGDWFYSGTGGESRQYTPPTGAHGVRLRRWPSNGLDPEYVDVEFANTTLVSDRGLDFNRKQPHSRLEH